MVCSRVRCRNISGTTGSVNWEVYLAPSRRVLKIHTAALSQQQPSPLLRREGGAAFCKASEESGRSKRAPLRPLTRPAPPVDHRPRHAGLKSSQEQTGDTSETDALVFPRRT